MPMRLWPGRGSVILFWNDSAQTLFVKKSFGGGVVSPKMLLVSGLQDSDTPTIIIAGFILLLDLIMIVAYLVDYFRKR